MGAAEKGKKKLRPGPRSKTPTDEQLARLPELKKRAHYTYQFGKGLELLSQAAANASGSQEKIDAAEKLWVKMLLAREPRAELTSGPSAASSRQPQASGPELPSASEEGGEPTIMGPAAIHMEIARRHLWEACKHLQAAATAAMDEEDVPLPGEQVDHILFRLVEDELGLQGRAAARLILGSKMDKMEAFERRAAEGKLAHQLLRRGRASKKVFDNAKADFLKGFVLALQKHGVNLDPRQAREVNQEVRRAVTAATTIPDLDKLVRRVKLT